MKKLLLISLAIIMAFVPSRLDARKVKFKNGDVYDGEWKNKAPNGMGVMIYANGEIYSGYWVNGIKNGMGTMVFLNKDEYLGDWKDDKFHGEGKMTYANKDFYQGAWEVGKKHGEGTMTYADGSVYTGSWVEDLYDGKGSYTAVNKDEYVGDWKAGKQCGEGEMKYADGASYSGFWLDGQYSGMGKKSFVNGDVYDGMWEKGVRKGEGEFFDKALSRIFKGNWTDSVVSGEGSIVFLNEATVEMTLAGEWLENGLFSTSFSKSGKNFSGSVISTSGDGVSGPFLSVGKVAWETEMVADGRWKANTSLATCDYKDMVEGHLRYNLGGRSFDGDVKDGKENNGKLDVTVPGRFMFTGNMKAGEPFGIYVGDFKASPFTEYDLSAWDQVLGEDIGRLDGLHSICGVFKDSLLTLRGMLTDGVPDGEVTMVYAAEDSLTMASSWIGGKLSEGRGVIAGTPFVIVAVENDNVQVDLENGERLSFVPSKPAAILPEINEKLKEQRTLRERMAAEMMGVAPAGE
ncbi:MAG: hypothetical protein K6F21_00855 [Bacteroidales bacterium]|nr:hypothetical protein [Bacteroidales bacterium]